MFAVVIWTFGELIASPISSVVIADLAPPTMRGVYQGVLNMAWGLAGFAGPLAGGFIFGRFGAPMLWIGCFIMGVCVAIGQFFLARQPSPQRPELALLSTSSSEESGEKVALYAEGALNND
jgi:MFS family permease